MDFLDQIAQNDEPAQVEGGAPLEQIGAQEVHPNVLQIGEAPNVPFIQSEEPTGNQDSQFFQNMDFVQPPAEMPSRSDSDQQVEQQPPIQDLQEDPFGGAEEYNPPNFGGSIPGFGGEEMDPEEQAAIAAREQEEQERLKMLAEKDREEYKEKEERRMKAQADLEAWHAQRHQEISKRREINFAAEQNFRDLQESFNSVSLENCQKENPWEKVVGNIETKAGNYPGTKDVGRLKKAILNKKADFGSLY